MSGRSLRLPGLATFSGAALAALLAAGCADGNSFSDPEKPDAAPDPGSPDAGPAAPTVLPFAVDSWFAPSGYMGDGESPGAIADMQVCADSRPASWMGNCHKITWTPGAMMWAGVYWQYPDGNWGDRPGLQIPAGATKITFQAWGATGNEQITFMAGMAAIDGFELKKEKVPLTTTPTEYSLELGGATYSRVVGGFGWVAADSTSAVNFYLDDIRWQ